MLSLGSVLVGSILAPDLHTGLHSSTFLPVTLSSGKNGGNQAMFTARDPGKAAFEPVNKCRLLLSALLWLCKHTLQESSKIQVQIQGR